MTIKQTISNAWTWTKEKAKWIILAVFSIGTVYAAGEIIEPPLKEPIKQEHLLKAPKEKILESKEVDWIEEVKDKQGNPTGERINKGRIIAYDYITDKKATGKFIWHKGDFTNARISEKPNTTDFFIGDHFYKDGNDVFEIEHGATTTIEAFDEQIKVSWLEKAIYPVRADTTTSYYVGAGDGDVTNFHSGGYPSVSWDTVHDDTAISSGWISHTTTAGGCRVAFYNNNGYVIGRGYYPIDTSALSSGSIISAASLFLNINGVVNVVNDGDDWMNIVETFQEDETSLTSTDYNDCGYDTGNETAGRSAYTPVEGSTRIDLGDMPAAGNYMEYDLNAAGRGWMSHPG